MRYDTYGYNDPTLVRAPQPWTLKKVLGTVLALTLILAVFYTMNQKLIHGSDWISQTYDNDEWRTNEGNLPTYGAWDIEAHVWKTEYIIKYFPNYHWNPYWYLGMPLLKYYQNGFYMLHWATMAITGTSAGRSSLLLVMFGHIAAVFATFLLCYKLSKRIWVSALCSLFVIANTFISLRSYGWEPITVVFLVLFPIGLLAFFKAPLQPFRFSVVITLGLAYLTHPLLWFSLCMTMGLYLISIALRSRSTHEKTGTRYIWAFVAAVFVSLLLGAVQFFPQVTYHQVSSGAHMGVKYLPYYQVPPNIIHIKDFLFDAGNLKGPGPIVMIAFLLLIIFAISDYRERNMGRRRAHTLAHHELVGGLALVLVTMVFFYYIELYNLFPMNMLRSIQYHRIIPEFIIVAAALIASMSNIAHNFQKKAVYYTMLIAFVLASGIVLYSVQTYWDTTPDISQNEEFIYDDFEGRISMPYTDQSLSVRNSWTEIPQVYGYYEQGITNSYNDEIFSVSSGFHNANITVLYLKAANVGRLYINVDQGLRDEIVRTRLNTTLPFFHEKGNRYGYFEVPLVDGSFAQAIDGVEATKVQELAPPCRVLFKEEYCGSIGEEFVTTDIAEVEYLHAYVRLLETPYEPTASMEMKDPQHYHITVEGATTDTTVVVKMDKDKDFTAHVNGKEVKIEEIGPEFMLIRPETEGNYEILLEYHVSKPVKYGLYVTIITFILLALWVIIAPRANLKKHFKMPRGDMK